ncbi:hypothetical protein NFC81_09155 [Salinispirillum sp. LH 10-3-1]|uniref:Uncharacterized protein n=1 Tax=Salinispirillum sp. LH 10-3-1 TaxID=2952525 RepID=A0AB38YC07_9GAMM
MKWQSARQCWHDAFFNGRPSVMAVAIDMANLGAAVQGGNREYDNAMHQVEAGMVQNVISKLPQHLQSLGHWLYAPFTAEERAKKLNLAAAIVAREADLQQLVAPGDWMPLITATMYEYARVVQGTDVKRKNGRTIKRWLMDELHYDLGDWTANHRRVYEAVWNAIDRLDRQALGPVAELVYDQTELRKTA